MLSFEAVNEARMLTMGAARTNIQNKLAGLTQLEQRRRQQDITAEVLELAGGAEALVKVRGQAYRRGHGPAGGGNTP
jgi:F-type H+-transporting ATPase subunit gamma